MDGSMSDMVVAVVDDRTVDETKSVVVDEEVWDVEEIRVELLFLFSVDVVSGGSLLVVSLFEVVVVDIMVDDAVVVIGGGGLVTVVVVAGQSHLHPPDSLLTFDLFSPNESTY